MELRNTLTADVTVVANRFIDQYMKDANGEYVKVYLYFVRHEGEVVTIESCALALDSTETDVRRAIAYWKKAGIFYDRKEEPGEKENGEAEAAGAPARRQLPGEMPVPVEIPAAVLPEARPERSCDMNRLAEDEEFHQLQYVAEQYMGKLLSRREVETLGYLYQTLGMPAEVLDFLMEHCAQNGHKNMRYAEKIALDWHSRGLFTAEAAKEYARTRTRAVFTVMNAMGLSDRNPGRSELTYIDRWFTEYGFGEDLVTEACNRTIARIHKPSFAYVDKILKAWKDGDVRTMEEVAAMDLARAGSGPEKREGRGTGVKAPAEGARSRRTRFHNFQDHGYDYNKLVLGMSGESPAADTGGEDGTDERAV